MQPFLAPQARPADVPVSAGQRQAIVMVDGRAPRASGADAYVGFCVAINALFAARHGYDLIYYRVATDNGMRLNFRDRHAAWARVPALAHATARLGYSRVTYLDTDAVINDHSTSIDAFVERHARRGTETQACAALSC